MHLLYEMGEELVALKDSPDADVRAFVALLMGRLHHEPPVTVPPEA